MRAYGSRKTYNEWWKTRRSVYRKKIHRVGKLMIKTRRKRITKNEIEDARNE